MDLTATLLENSNAKDTDNSQAHNINAPWQSRCYQSHKQIAICPNPPQKCNTKTITDYYKYKTQYPEIEKSFAQLKEPPTTITTSDDKTTYRFFKVIQLEVSLPLKMDEMTRIALQKILISPFDYHATYTSVDFKKAIRIRNTS
ncbi:hypothetical protein FUT69_06335 [Xylella taiwanensis]|nr:hypothetical protein [Xylella taiwanensis]AXI83342.1 hypothetical protein AB672_05020 [Xylella taiwanensis]MCD8456407.1 hypothetical protein [Xylella taiwanensis]MCD8458815.1 hypothetical protein [Xylella taiwanensis]MCD8460951.1 hypothetical protein [Xylella taiwanensis]MCD8465459.1 hypothetical protein [Xylella taiwanensis]